MEKVEDVEEISEQIDPLELFSVVPSDFDIGNFLKKIKECQQSKKGIEFTEFLNSVGINNADEYMKIRSKLNSHGLWLGYKQTERQY